MAIYALPGALFLTLPITVVSGERSLSSFEVDYNLPALYPVSRTGEWTCNDLYFSFLVSVTPVIVDTL